jgi:hypothetical protein
MIGMIPCASKTFIVEDKIGSTNLIEGRLYFDTDGRLFLYSTKERRSNPNTQYFPIWDGNNKYITQFSNFKYMDKDVIITDIDSLSSSINNNMAKDILYKQRLVKNDEYLDPKISDNDNTFTQCIKRIISIKQITLCDLIDMSSPILEEGVVNNYYSSLNKITFMRYDKWCVWLDVILHLRYLLNIYKKDKKLLLYKYPENVFDTGNVKYDSAINLKSDPFKNIVKIILIMENINKSILKSEEVDDYTINNLFTTLNNKKPLSSQLFDRFIRISGLSYDIVFYELEGGMIFTYSKN